MQFCFSFIFLILISFVPTVVFAQSNFMEANGNIAILPKNGGVFSLDTSGISSGSVGLSMEVPNIPIRVAGNYSLYYIGLTGPEYKNSIIVNHLNLKAGYGKSDWEIGTGVNFFHIDGVFSGNCNKKSYLNTHLKSKFFSSSPPSNTEKFPTSFYSPMIYFRLGNPNSSMFAASISPHWGFDLHFQFEKNQHRPFIQLTSLFNYKFADSDFNEAFWVFKVGDLFPITIQGSDKKIYMKIAVTVSLADFVGRCPDSLHSTQNPFLIASLGIQLGVLYVF
jgi:hypothetical protein